MGVKWGPRLSSSIAISSIIIIALMLPIILSPPISSSLQLDIQLGVFAQQNNSDKPDVVITHGITSADDNQNSTWRNMSGDFKSINDPSVNWNNISEVRSVYQDDWKFNRNDTYFKDFLKNTSMYSQWDDHEIINDFGSKWPYWNLFNSEREGYPNIVNEGTKADSLRKAS